MRLLGGGAWFALGFVAVSVAAAAVIVYVFGQVERIKGPHTTFVILAWLSPVYACIGAACYMLGLRSEPHTPGAVATVALGGVVALLFWLTLSLGYLQPVFGMLAWVMLILGAFLAPRFLRAFTRGRTAAGP